MSKTKKQFHKITALLRITLGWYFFYAGFSKVINSSWSAAGYLSNAKLFPQFFTWLASPVNIGWVNFLNEWGLLLIGVSLIVGLWVRWASYAGIIMMALYWLAALDGIKAGHGILVDEHIIYILVFALLIASRAGKHWGLDSKPFYKLKGND